MQRPIGALALAILSFLQGVYQVYVLLIYLGVTSFNFVGNPVTFPNPQWGQAVLAGIMALIYFWVAYGFWTVRVWAWLYGLLITGFNLLWYALATLGPAVSMEMVLVPIVINLLIFGYLFHPSTRLAFYESEGSRMDAMMDARQSGAYTASAAPATSAAPPAAAPAPAPAAPPPADTPPAPPPSAPPSGSDTGGTSG
ncbi:MAG TPA: hypothetical protein VFO05_09700 [Candidatus Limnocylindrales bacterium]|nr:hypothetical protein [Candidatus Limnocylindrales bacterium]